MSILSRINKILLILVLLLSGFSLLFGYPGYRYLYKEQLYSLYHKHLYMYPERYAENIHWLEQTIKADFANPLNALAHIETKKEWEWYRNLFNMHVNLLLTRNYLQWAKGYYKEHAYFFNEPWKDMNIRSMKKAIALIEVATLYWEEALKNITDIKAMKLNFLNLEEIQNWEDEYYRINTRKLNYATIIDRELARIERIKKEFLAMDENTF